MKKVIVVILAAAIFAGCSGGKKWEEVRNSASGKSLIEEVTENSYVVGAVISDGGILIVAITDEKSAEMLASYFLRKANRSYNLNLKGCKIVSAIGARKGENYIHGTSLAFVTASQIK